MSNQTELPAPTTSSHGEPQLIRGVGLWGATTLNMIDMIGVGPFITIPLIVAAMNGPQAMIGWVVGALLVICDGLVWAELGAAFPGTGGTYRYLGEIYGKGRLGRLMSFLFIWQLTIIARLSNLLWLGVMLTIVWIVASGLWHFDPALAFDFPPGAFTLRPEFFY